MRKLILLMCLLSFTVKSNYLVKLDTVYKRTESNEIRIITEPKGLPINTKVVSHFGYRKHPILGIVRLHKGVDLDAEIGDTVKSTIHGVVIHDKYASGYGKTVLIKNKDYVIRIAHLSKTLVHIGDTIKRDQKIGLAGCTGLCSGPHVHYEIYHKGKLINPLNEMRDRHGSTKAGDSAMCFKCRE